MDYDASAYRPARRRRSIGWFIPIFVVLILAAGWCAFWFYAADRGKEMMAGWMAREAKSGRVYSCGQQTFGGFPFRFEMRCKAARAELSTTQPPLTFATDEVLAAVQVYQPTLLISELSGPLNVSDPGQPPKMVANWSLAQVSVRGTPRAPERVSIVLSDPVLDRPANAANAPATGSERVFSGKRAEVHGRMASGSVTDQPVIDIAAKFVAAVAPGVHPLMNQPLDIDLDTTLRGLKDFQPKPWTARMRELQQAGGRIEVKNLRLRQADVVAVAFGSLALTPAGMLDGELQVTAAGIEKIMTALGLDKLAKQGGSRGDRVGAALSLLDKLAPGAIAGAVSMLGEPAELEGKRATKMPLRFKDGAVTLGPLPVGQMQPLF